MQRAAVQNCAIKPLVEQSPTQALDMPDQLRIKPLQEDLQPSRAVQVITALAWKDAYGS